MRWGGGIESGFVEITSGQPGFGRAIQPVALMLEFQKRMRFEQAALAERIFPHQSSMQWLLPVAASRFADNPAEVVFPLKRAEKVIERRREKAVAGFEKQKKF